MICELKDILIKKEKELFYNKVIILDVANLISACGSLRNYKRLVKRLKKYTPKEVYCLANASTKYHLSTNELKNYLNIVESGEIKECPTHCEFEVFLIQMGINIPNSLILTCDNLNDYQFNITSQLNIIKFMIIDSSIYFNLNLKSKKNIIEKMKNKDENIYESIKIDKSKKKIIRNEATWLELLFSSDNTDKCFRIYEKEKKKSSIKRGNNDEF